MSVMTKQLFGIVWLVAAALPAAGLVVGLGQQLKDSNSSLSPTGKHVRITSSGQHEIGSGLSLILQQRLYTLRSLMSPVLKQRLHSLLPVAFVLICTGFALNYFFASEVDETIPLDDKGDEVGGDCLNEDINEFLIVAMIRDGIDLAQSTWNGARLARVCITMLLSVLTSALQIFIFVELLTFVLPQEVHKVRTIYNDYEVAMYDHHIYVTVDGESRGRSPDYFNPDLFSSLSVQEQSDVCNLPFSQPWFFMPILWIWTMTCVAEIKDTCILFQFMILRLPTVSHVSEALKTPCKQLNTSERVIVGLTWWLKALVTILVLVPRFLTTCFLLWLGSRWLAASLGLSEVVTNTVAVEFILHLKNLLYITCVSYRSKCEFRETKILVRRGWKEKDTLWNLVSSTMWALLAFAWVLYYVYYFQMVLLNFKFDLTDVCTTWLNTNYPSNLV